MGIDTGESAGGSMMSAMDNDHNDDNTGLVMDEEGKIKIKWTR